MQAAPSGHENVNLDMIADRIVARQQGISAVDLQHMLELVSPIDGSLTEDYAMRRLEKIKHYQELVADLAKIPIIEQKSAEWHRVRQTIVTASDFAQALGEGKFGTQRDFLVKKSGYVNVPFDADCPPLKWGVMFEDVACAIYEKRNKLRVLPFGLLRHPNVDHFGASPDGITTLGVMVEIKCPYRRKINNEVPKQYYYQIQGQLDVCNLDECDFLECEFRRVSNLEELSGLSEPREIGAIYEDSNSTDDGPGRYEYSPIFASDPTGFADLEKFVMDKRSRQDGRVEHLWYLDVVNVIRVYRDREFISQKMVELAEVWSRVISYRNDRELYDREVSETAKRVTKTKVPVTVTLTGLMKGYGFVGDD
jgi:putative phage-type endonuclease